MCVIMLDLYFSGYHRTQHTTIFSRELSQTGKHIHINIHIFRNIIGNGTTMTARAQYYGHGREQNTIIWKATPAGTCRTNCSFKQVNA